jgi:Flp pilus assembly protein TadB
MNELDRLKLQMSKREPIAYADGPEVAKALDDLKDHIQQVERANPHLKGAEILEILDSDTVDKAQIALNDGIRSRRLQRRKFRTTIALSATLLFAVLALVVMHWVPVYSSVLAFIAVVGVYVLIYSLSASKRDASGNSD